MSLPFPPPDVEFTIENLRRYSMLRPQYEYDGSGPFDCCKPRKGPSTIPDYQKLGRNAMWEAFYDKDPRHEPPPACEDDYSETSEDPYDYWEEEDRDRDANVYYDSETDTYETLPSHPVSCTRRMRWLSRLTLAVKPCNV